MLSTDKAHAICAYYCLKLIDFYNDLRLTFGLVSNDARKFGREGEEAQKSVASSSNWIGSAIRNRLIHLQVKTQ